MNNLNTIPNTPATLATPQTYLERRLRELLATATPPNQTNASTTTKPGTAPHRQYYVGQPAREALIAQAGGPRAVSRYLNELARLNPTPHYWRDTRPTDLSDLDLARLTATPPLLPLWTDGNDRRDGGTLTLLLLPRTVDTFAQVARHWGIGQQKYVIRSHYRPMERLRSTPLHKLDTTSPRTLTTCVLRALGQGYLTPAFTPNAKGETNNV